MRRNDIIVFGYDQTSEGYSGGTFLRIEKNRIRIFGAGYWRKGKKIYEQENKI
ncbi:hypothetical protein [uncultured Paraglaciecola sp.]|uniref:hypothetical protein n=1 Tax=uncultured Paraglaciecola sp. TaxID=1765024 RepID=UPI0026170C4C|nr:hypothetical protein [uncultured Paraglaciecola sp.]